MSGFGSPQIVELVCAPYGDDLFIVNNARQSFGSDRRSLTFGGKEARLIGYLARNGHWTPFGHPHMTFRVVTPIPIARQLMRSTVGFVVSEESRRYVSGPVRVFLPAELRSKPEGSIKQGSGAAHPDSDAWRHELAGHYADGIGLYDGMIASGICPEQARFALPQGAMTEFTWTGSLFGFARVCKLRLDSHAQGEVQEVARRISDLIRPHFPVSWGALMAAALPDQPQPETAESAPAVKATRKRKPKAKGRPTPTPTPDTTPNPIPESKEPVMPDPVADLLRKHIVEQTEARWNAEAHAVAGFTDAVTFWERLFQAAASMGVPTPVAVAFPKAGDRPDSQPDPEPTQEERDRLDRIAEAEHRVRSAEALIVVRALEWADADHTDQPSESALIRAVIDRKEAKKALDAANR